MSKLTVQFDADKTRLLKCGFRQLVELEKALKQESEDSSSFEEMFITYHTLLKWEDPELTKQQTIDILDIAADKHGMEYVNEKMKEIMSKINGKAELPS